MVETSATSNPLDTSIQASRNTALKFPGPEVPALEPKSVLPQRLIVGAMFVSLGAVAAAIGLASIGYRVMHLTVDGGLVNGRTVRVSSPVDGQIKAFYARPGVQVSSGQLLARLEPNSPEVQKNSLELEGQIRTRQVQITTTQQSVNFLTQQLQSVRQQDQGLQSTNAQLAANDVSNEQAAVTAAIARESAARTEYERYRQLLAEGVVSQQQVDQLESDWKEAKAAVDQARAELSSAQTSRTAISGGIPLKDNATLQDQELGLQREIQRQMAQITTLQAEVEALKRQLGQFQADNRKKSDLEVAAPFTGVVYKTNHDEGELVTRPTTLLTLLDCNDLWLETLVPVEQANRIDAQKPVRVMLAGSEDTIVGEVELIEAVTPAELAEAQAQALTPAVPSRLEGQPLAKVTVRIPPIAQQEQSNQFCGVGQMARATFAMNFSLF